MKPERFLVRYPDGKAEVLDCATDVLPAAGMEFPPGWVVTKHNLADPSGVHDGEGYSYEVWVERPQSE